ncbi:disease resistance protein RUN1-like [Eucalyptus grandis]|uniref:disease resistance protein RUN1-like n=1 Tax=Eucalyptus grandis TaxID=71139 RepID=UPI00192E89A5|nr:disease resistance protein RUN1-like [Eucalyptus grandis]
MQQKSIFLSNSPLIATMDNGRSHIETNEGMHPSFISPTPTGEGNDHYDVFLSFRGSDTRKEFADHLYHSLDKAGIVPVFVFRDDKSIPIGEEFGPRILDAIARSKILILIISKNYASSKWCLRELIHIMDHAKSTSHIVLPIFYKVDPSDVRHLKGSFGMAFHSCKEYFDEEDIHKGQQALKEVSYLHGWESEKVANGHEGELVRKVIEKVLSKLRRNFQLDVTEHLLGIDDHVNRIMKWVDTPTTNARMIGIYGMGGIGKTTLAKVIYNQLSNDFVHRSFLADIRETACRNNIVHLQKQLIKGILQIEPQFGNVDDGINLIKSRFKGKKVLILLDDIDHEDQLNALAREHNWFMAGSVIIVTTRYKAILDQSKFDVHKYDLNELDQEHALLLFNRHAFYMDQSSKDFEGLSRDIVSTMGGLPLALKVVGSYLYKKPNQKVWEDVRKQLKSQPHRDVQKILQISYDALEDGHKQIFLDIVCFFIGVNGTYIEYAMYMWEDCGFYPSQGIEELKLRCLIKIGDCGQFEMHDQLRDLGRSIFCQGQPPEKRSGPWDDDYDGVPKVLRTYRSVKYGTPFFFFPSYFNIFNLIYSNMSSMMNICSCFLGRKIYVNIHLCPS